MCPSTTSGSSIRSLDTPEFRLRCEDNARTRLEALIPDEARAFCQPVTQVIWGKPYRRILDVAENQATDLIVMGVHGRNAIDLMLFGSTTTRSSGTHRVRS